MDQRIKLLAFLRAQSNDVFVYGWNFSGGRDSLQHYGSGGSES
jgi:hypothetical protein